MRIAARRAGLALLAASIAWLAVSAAAAHLVSRRPRAPYDEPLPEVEWAAVEPVAFEAADGASVRGHAFVAGAADRAVVLLHMNQADRGAMEPAARIWAGLGWSSVAVSLRGHGDAEGERLDYGLEARHDAAAAVAWARERFGGPIVVHGVSLGAAAALLAAESGGPLADGYVLEAPFTSIVTAIHDRTSMRLPPVLDRLAAESLLAVAPLVRPGTSGISPLRAARSIPPGTPALLLASTLDRRAPLERVRRFQEVLGPATRLETAAVAHAAWQSRPDLLEPALQRWLEESEL
ncbi:MAG: alpha/beta fold hydrolase [Planctomycetota bacterium]|nr:alpha/beta fold hydrolase [Planctomycetota bacterium]